VTSHDEFRIDLPGYLAHELPESRAAEVRRHLAGCDACRREAEELRDVSTLLRSAPLEHEPPPHLERQVMTLVELDRAAGDPVHLAESPTRPDRSPAMRLLALAAAGLALIGIVLGAMSLRLRDRAVEAEDRNQAWEDVYGSWGESVREVQLSGEGLAPGDVVASFIHHGGNNFGISMRAEGLRNVRSGSRYEVWLSNDESWASTGSFEISPTSDRVFYFHLGEDPRSYDKIWITLEPDDGDPDPSGNAVARAALDI
jgi:hypothetical protein